MQSPRSVDAAGRPRTRIGSDAHHARIGGEMTDQELFDTVTRHLLTQNATAMEGDGQCKYRTEDGKKCAIGCLIPDDRYDHLLEGRGVGSRRINDAAGISDDQVTLARRLQSVHDIYFPPDWPRILRGAASEFGLSPHVIEEFR